MQIHYFWKKNFDPPVAVREEEGKRIRSAEGKRGRV
jgi:hypothetical protein